MPVWLPVDSSDVSSKRRGRWSRDKAYSNRASTLERVATVDRVIATGLRYDMTGTGISTTGSFIEAKGFLTASSDRRNRRPDLDALRLYHLRRLGPHGRTRVDYRITTYSLRIA